jgi:hypothetical protein
MLIQAEVLNAVPNARGSGTQNAMQLQLGELAVSELLPRYAALTWSGQVFSVSVATAAAITAYSGGAAGTPQIAVWNPVGSGKNLWVLSANYANVVAASAAGTVTWGLYYGPTAAITAAASAAYPVSQLTMLPSGSAAKAFVNAALTGSTALTNIVPLGSYYWATAAGAALVTQASPPEIPGWLCIPPGSMVALGGSAALTSATWQGNMIWGEAPV